MTVQEQKAKLRKSLRHRFEQITETHQEKLQAHLLDWLSGQTGTWGAFWPLPGEPDLRPVWAKARHLNWVFPRIDGEALRFHQPQDTHWVIGSYGIREPAAFTAVVEMSQIQGLLIPGLGFDRQGRRLGKGKGFYDRLLGQWMGLKVGVGFETQWELEIPVDEFDQSIDLIVTEAGPWRPPGK